MLSQKIPISAFRERQTVNAGHFTFARHPIQISFNLLPLNCVSYLQGNSIITIIKITA